MSDKLLLHYDKELAFIQQSAAEFARRHPGAAGRLRLGTDTVDDPLVGRLFSGVAYLNARIQQKLDDEFPELTDALLETLYPHYLRPIPSMSIARFEPTPDLDAVVEVPRKTLLDTEAVEGESCRFSTCYPVDVAPISVDSADLLPRPFIAPGSTDIRGAGAVLRLQLKTLSQDVLFSALDLSRLRFYLRGQSQHVYPLYDLLLTKTLKIVLARSDADSKPVYLEAGHLQQAGFEPADGILPYPDNAFIGYRLLTEFFVFPEKFLFLDLIDLAGNLPADLGRELNIYFYLTDSDSELEHQISAKTFALGCTPVVNLFEQVADPIALDQTQYTYPIIPDARRSTSMEIYSINNVQATDMEGKEYEYTPFYGTEHRHTEKNHGTFWFPHRRNVVEGEHLNEAATEVDISLVDLNFNPFGINNQTLQLKLTCCNRNRPKKLQSGGGKPFLTDVKGEAPVKRISSVTPPTATLRANMKERGYWRLISHLNLNHLSLSSSDQSLEALKEILRLYDFFDSPSTRSTIEAIHGLATKPITAPIQIEDTTALCRGTEVEIVFDPVMLAGSSPLLFASVLERFLGLYCSINSFTRLIVRLAGKEGELKRWPPRAGEKALL
ncbi:type VI secretion system baseplate subunit TssF [Exilibacterium tricleocarpae]|uniref:Type VI secretion system baseplate subunit TssF n=1 Tax=Exilibacterium tricleocarpae TaxID=2591008 RepID=A0A545SPK8_9GAMM|nr:type VI secretion system baseplate subunit TssF [Exilibacterium tricleocarpae]TQV66915.1 type VI secretion system baseplate subunit TssF [Exilibacterium tricleocarpae]